MKLYLIFAIHLMISVTADSVKICATPEGFEKASAGLHTCLNQIMSQEENGNMPCDVCQDVQVTMSIPEAINCVYSSKVNAYIQLPIIQNTCEETQQTTPQVISQTTPSSYANKDSTKNDQNLLGKGEGSSSLDDTPQQYCETPSKVLEVKPAILGCIILINESGDNSRLENLCSLCLPIDTSFEVEDQQKCQYDAFVSTYKNFQGFREQCDTLQSSNPPKSYPPNGYSPNNPTAPKAYPLDAPTASNANPSVAGTPMPRTELIPNEGNGSSSPKPDKTECDAPAELSSMKEDIVHCIFAYSMLDDFNDYYAISACSCCSSITMIDIKYQPNCIYQQHVQAYKLIPQINERCANSLSSQPPSVYLVGSATPPPTAYTNPTKEIAHRL